MHPHHFGQYATTSNEGEFDTVELRRTVDSLRRDFLSMSTDIREVLKENEKLQREVDFLKEHRLESRGQAHGVPAARRVKDEVDELIRLHEMASRGGTRTERHPSAPLPTVGSEQSSQSAWFKKMMMVMMMAQMV